MKHITESYNQPDNKIVCTDEEYVILKAAFEPLGIDFRITEFDGATGTRTIQYQNLYQQAGTFLDPAAQAKLKNNARTLKWRY